MFSLNSPNSVTKIFVITVKGLKPATSSVRGQDATTVLARHMYVKGRISKLTQFMLQWFIRFVEFTEFLFHLGKTAMERLHREDMDSRSFNFGKEYVEEKEKCTQTKNSRDVMMAWWCWMRVGQTFLSLLIVCNTMLEVFVKSKCLL